MDISDISSDTVDIYSKIASDYDKAKPHLYDTQKFAEFANVEMQKDTPNSLVRVLMKAEESVKPGDTEEIGIQRVKRRFFGPEGKPEQGLYHKMLNDAKLNKNNICQLVFGKAGQQKLVFGKARGGLADGGCGAEMKQALDTQPEEVINKVSKQSVKPGESTQLRTMARQILSKLPKGGRLGAILAGAGAVGLGAGAMMSDAEAEEAREDETMLYNATEGRFVKPDGEPEDQMGILNWIADNPVKSSLAAMPMGYGLGLGANKLGAAKAASYLTSWKAMIPAMMIPEKIMEFREGDSLGEMATNPWNALWAVGIDSNASALKKGQYYIDLLPEGHVLKKQFANAKGAEKIRLGQQAFNKTGADVFGTDFWKSGKKMQRLGKSIMSPSSKGTDLVFNQRLQPMIKKLAETAGSPFAQRVAKQGLGTLAKRAALGIGAAALLPLAGAGAAVTGGLTAALLGADYIREQFSDYNTGKAKIDMMRMKGQISEQDARNYESLLLQENLLPFGLGLSLIHI